MVKFLHDRPKLIWEAKTLSSEVRISRKGRAELVSLRRPSFEQRNRIDEETATILECSNPVQVHEPVLPEGVGV